MAEIPAGYDPMGPTPVGLPDKKGNPFNPSIHQVYKTGRAFLNRVGEWVLKGGRPKKDAPPVSAPEKTPEKGVPAPDEKGAKGFDPAAHFEGRKPVAVPAEKAAETPAETLPPKMVQGATLPSEPSDPMTPAGAPSESPAGDAAGASTPATELEQTSRAAVVMAESLLIMALGMDMKHTGEERAALLESWKGFLADKDGVRLPPWMGLLVCYGSLISLRSDRPTFQKRLTQWGDRFKRWFGRG